jgi:hypothetical protein
MKTITIICEWCGKSVTKTGSGGGKKWPPRFCDRACSARWRMSRPDFVAMLTSKRDPVAAAEAMRRNWENPAFVESLRTYLKSDRNPFRDPATRAKSEAVLRAQGYSMLNGGNGTGLTVPQRLLSEELDWPTEFIVRTRMPRGSGYPTHYKLDIANPAEMIAVEVDGHSHTLKDRIRQDVKKDEFLESLGWLVVRIKNEDVLENCPRVARDILSLTWKHPLATTLPMAS